MEKIEFYFDKFLSQKVEKEIKYLFISYVVYLEELLAASKITQEEYQSKRKQILDSGNSAIRNINEQIDSIFSNLKVN
jgi:hypothetical protein